MLLHGLGDELLHALETMNCGLVVRDNAGLMVHVNQRLLDWLGYHRDELEGHPVDCIVPPDIRDLVMDEMKAVDAGDLRVRLTVLRRRDGTVFPVLGIPKQLKDSEGRLMGGVGVIVPLDAVETAKPAGFGSTGLRGKLEGIALQLQSLALAAQTSPTSSLVLDRPELGELTPREREVVALLLAGERAPAIAKKLHVSPHTVRNHLKSVFRKLGVGSQSALLTRLRTLSAWPIPGEMTGTGR